MKGSYRSTRDAPPSHLTLKIETFSTLLSSSLDRYESSEFEACGHKWKLALYPNGNKNRGINSHVSLYLALVGKNTSDKEMQVSFTFFLYDHFCDKYLFVQDRSRFHGINNFESGIDEFVPLADLKNPEKHYLVDDTCVFGAEVFVIKNESKVQCLSMAKVKPDPFKYTWKLEKFSKLDGECYYSPKFTTRGHDWQLLVHPKGFGTEKGSSLSIYLQLADSALLTDSRNVIVEYTLRVVDQTGSNHHQYKDTESLNSSKINWGWHKFLNLSALNKGTGYLVNDTCVLQAEVIVLGSSKTVK